MTERRFYLHKRRGIFYAELLDKETGLKLTARSTGTKNRDEALLTVAKWLDGGIPMPRLNGGCRRMEAQADLQGILRAIPKAGLDGAGAMQIVEKLRALELIDIPAVPKNKTAKTFTQSLLSFWDYEASEYVKDRKAHGHGITERHCHNSVMSVNKHWKPYFADKPINGITRQELKDFGFHLQKQGLSHLTVNHVLSLGFTAFNFWHKEGLIPANPAQGIGKFAGLEKKRGVLTEAEAETLFGRDWKDGAAYAGNLTAAVCGLRAGEVLAIRRNDIGEKTLDVSHSWNERDGLKSPKNGEARRVPLAPELRVLLLETLAATPHTDTENPFVFWGMNAEKPREEHFLLDGLDRELKGMGIDRKERNIVFHSWRHFYAARLADITDLAKVQRVIGHKTAAMTEHYAAHIEQKQLDEMASVSRFAFKGILRMAG